MMIIANAAATVVLNAHALTADLNMVVAPTIMSMNTRCVMVEIHANVALKPPNSKFKTLL